MRKVEKKEDREKRRVSHRVKNGRAEKRARRRREVRERHGQEETEVADGTFDTKHTSSIQSPR